MARKGHIHLACVAAGLLKRDIDLAFQKAGCDAGYAHLLQHVDTFYVGTDAFSVEL